MEPDSIGIKNNKNVDKFRTLKISFKKIEKEGINYEYMNECIIKTHKLVIKCYQFLRLFILYKIKKNSDIPIITRGIINMVFKTLTLKSAGPSPKGENLQMFNEFTDFYNSEFINLTDSKIDSTNMSSILDACAIDMVTNIENHVKLHFFSCLRKFVNQCFKKENDEILENFKGNKYYSKKKELASELNYLKKDLEDGTKTCDEKYHLWLDKYRTLILPTNLKDTFSNDIICNPQKYLKYMVNMNIILEKNELSQFQFFPLRTEVAPKYVQLDTKAIIDIFIDTNKNECFNNIENYKNGLWATFFKTDKKVFRMKNYKFKGTIYTDGYAVSILFIHDNFVEQEKGKRQNNLKLRKKKKEMLKDKTPDEQAVIIKNIDIDKKINSDKMKLKNKKKKEQLQEEFKKLPKEEQLIIKEKMKKKKHIEFPYIDELDSKQLLDLKTKKKIYIDPGKRSLFYMVDDNDNYFNYTNRTRISETKRLKYKKLVENFKKKENITTIESELSNYNSKSCDYIKFKDYVKKKNEINKKLFEQYEKRIFRKLKWYSFMNNERSDSNLLNKIEKLYGKDIIIIIGDWSLKKQMKNFISTPNIRLKRVLATRFTVYTVDEFRTSCLHFKMENKVNNLYLPDKKGKLRKLHAVLTSKMENQRIGCINRDKNGVKNIRKIVQEYINYGERPYNFRRDVKIENIISYKKFEKLTKIDYQPFLAFIYQENAEWSHAYNIH